MPVIVTPEIVQPLPAGQARPRLDLPKPLGPDSFVESGLPAPAPAAPAGAIPFETLLESLSAEKTMKLEQEKQGSSWSAQAATSLPLTPTAPASPPK